jgi:hypothetical protein
LVALFNEAGMIVAEANDPEAAREATSAELDSFLAGLQSRGNHVDAALRSPVAGSKPRKASCGPRDSIRFRREQDVVDAAATRLLVSGAE